MSFFDSAISRRHFLIASAASAAASQIHPARADGKKSVEALPGVISSGLFFKPALVATMWDTWMYYHDNQFYLYYLSGPISKHDGVGLAVSSDGIRWKDFGKVIQGSKGTEWVGSGAVWEIPGENQKKKFIMNFSEWRPANSAADTDINPSGRQTIFFAESEDLIHWKRLPDVAFHQDPRWYDVNGRWDNVWVVPRPGGGFYGYWAATPKNGKGGIGFGESSDGLTWQVHEPSTLTGYTYQTEVGAVHSHAGKYYVMASRVYTDFKHGMDWDRVRMTTFVGDSPQGPFRPAAKNHLLLVGNASYFPRFVDTPDGVLVNHHSWELDFAQLQNVAAGHVYMAPLKRADWDDEGTLRLKWWERYDRIKQNPIAVDLPKATSGVPPYLLKVNADRDRTLIMEGVLTIPEATETRGIFLGGSGNTGVVFLVRPAGVVEYGVMRNDGRVLETKGMVDRELALQGPVHFRLIREGRMTEFYLNDYLMQCYCLPEQGSGKIGLTGPVDGFKDLRVWYVDKNLVQSTARQLPTDTFA